MEAGDITEGQAPLVQYGKDLITNTSYYLGPKGKRLQITNGMNCQNCHVQAGTSPTGYSLIDASSTYPLYRDRSGQQESLEYRINECFTRSLNGTGLDSSSTEMKALLAYLNWLGDTMQPRIILKDTGWVGLPLLTRAADPVKGKQIYSSRCSRCHADHGGGVLTSDSSGYINPPLWGTNSYTVSAGMHRISKLASFIYKNMPADSVRMQPVLLTEEAWDVAAFICSQPRADRKFEKDWPQLETKPPDYPFGPYADSFSEQQHRYGPYGPIWEYRKRGDHIFIQDKRAQRLQPGPNR